MQCIESSVEAVQPIEGFYVLVTISMNSGRYMKKIWGNMLAVCPHFPLSNLIIITIRGRGLGRGINSSILYSRSPSSSPPSPHLFFFSETSTSSISMMPALGGGKHSGSEPRFVHYTTMDSLLASSGLMGRAKGEEMVGRAEAGHQLPLNFQSTIIDAGNGCMGYKECWLFTFFSSNFTLVSH